MKTSIASYGLALALAALSLTSPASAKEKKPVDPNKKVCRSETPTGSRLTKSTCHTAAEWAQLDEANASAAHDFQAQSTRNTPN